MERKLGSHSWPKDLLAVKETILGTTKFDDQVENNKDCAELLPIFLEMWESLFPMAVELENAVRNQSSSLGLTIEHLEHPEPNSYCPSNASNGNTFCPKIIEPESCQSTTHECSSAEEQSTASTKADSDDEDSDSSGKNELETNEECKSPLEHFYVRAENIGWQDFKLRLLSEELYDFIFVDPQQSLSPSELNQNMWTEFKDDRKIREFANFCCLSLRPGCYAFIFVLAEEFCAWSSALQAEGMEVMKAPFLVIPSSDSARMTRLKNLPQSCGELAVVAKAPGCCPGFKVNFSGGYEMINCTFSRKFGIIDNTPRCANNLKRPNSKSEVRQRERHPDIIAEIIDTFCVPKGTVLDVFGGALSTAFSCISSGRACVILEKDSYCFNLAMRRLEKACRDRLMSPEQSKRARSDISGSEDISSTNLVS